MRAVGVELSHFSHQNVVRRVASVLGRRLEGAHGVRTADKQSDVDRSQQQERKPFLRVEGRVVHVQHTVGNGGMSIARQDRRPDHVVATHNVMVHIGGSDDDSETTQEEEEEGTIVKKRGGRGSHGAWQLREGHGRCSREHLHERNRAHCRARAVAQPMQQ